MVPLVRDLFREHVHHPEQGDEHDRNDEQHEDGDEIRHRVFGLGDINDADADDGQASDQAAASRPTRSEREA